MEFNLAKKEAKFDLRLAYALFPEKIISKKHNSYWTTKQSVWHSKFQLYELLQYLFPEFKEHLSSQEFSLAKNMLNRKLILQTGTSDSNSAQKQAEWKWRDNNRKISVGYKWDYKNKAHYP